MCLISNDQMKELYRMYQLWGYLDKPPQIEMSSVIKRVQERNDDNARGGSSVVLRVPQLIEWETYLNVIRSEKRALILFRKMSTTHELVFLIHANLEFGAASRC